MEDKFVKAAFTPEEESSRDALRESIVSMMENSADIFRSKLDSSSTNAALPTLEIGTNAPATEGQEKSLAIQGDKVVPVEVSDKPLAQVEREKAVTATVTAIKSGDMNAIQKALTDAHDKYGADKSEFDAYANKLREDLKAQGFDMKMGTLINGRSINIHQQGSPNAVGFDVTTNRDTKKSEVKVVAYDWINKGKASESADEVVKGFATPKENAAANLKEHGQLAELFNEGFKKGSVLEAHQEMLKTAAHEFERGGMDAVRALERRMASKTDANRGRFPAFTLEGDKLNAVTAELVSDPVERAKAADDPAYRANNGFALHPEYGVIKVISSTGPTVLRKK